MKPYPSYTLSNLPWVPEVPSHWSLVPNGAVLRRKKLLVGEKQHESTLLSLTKNGIIIRDLSKMKGKFSADMATFQQVKPGDLVFCLFDVPETPRTVGLSYDDGMITGAYTVFTTNADVIGRFIELYYIALDDRKMLGPLYSGLRNTIPASTFLQTKLPLPPLPEQKAIVKYLDHMDRKIKKYIRAKQKMIKLLEEQKQAIIHQAVTRGLDPNVKLKPSGVEWLGEIPEGWEVRRLKYLTQNLDHIRRPLSSVIRGGMTRKEYDYYGASGIIDRVEDFLFDYSTILIAEDGANLLLRNLPLVIHAKGKYWVNNHAHILLPKKCNFEYLMYFLEDIDYNIWISGAAQPKLTKDRLMSIHVLNPSIMMQEKIVLYLKDHLSGIAESVFRIKKEISLLQEYRTRLISDVVTGKLDVRELAEDLPDEVDLPVEDPLEDLEPEEDDNESEEGDLEE